MDSQQYQPDFEIKGLNRRDFLIQFHKPLQKAIFLFAGPVQLAIFLYWHWVSSSWRSWLLLAFSFALYFFWYLGYQLGKKDKVTESVFCIALPASIQGAISLLLLDGLEVPCFWAMFAGTIYAGVFDRRPLYICIAIAIVVPILSELVEHYDIYQPAVVPTEFRLIPTAGMTLLTLSFVPFFIVRSQAIGGKMFRSLGIANEKQQGIIHTIRETLLEINHALVQIRKTTSKVASQSDHLAQVTSEIKKTMTLVNERALETAKTASVTHGVAEKTHEMSTENSRHLRAVELGFERGMKMISEAASEVTTLATQMEHIEEILEFNRQIGEQIQLLAINATIEADGAGAYGKIFGDVAREFKKMITDTEENTVQSRSLLHAIRDQARENSLAIADGSSKLKHYFQDLQTTAKIVEENAGLFQMTALQLESINGTANRMQKNVADVSSAIIDIDKAGIELRKSARVLEKNVARIESSEQGLSELLDVERQEAGGAAS